jgi:hypothetical protein
MKMVRQDHNNFHYERFSLLNIAKGFPQQTNFFNQQMIIRKRAALPPSQTRNKPGLKECSAPRIDYISPSFRNFP